MWILSLAVLAATIFAIVDIVLRRDDEIRHLPKVAWLFLVILIPLFGMVLWFAIGREPKERTPRPRRAPAPASSPASAPSPRSAGGDPRSTEQQMADLEREIEEDRLRAEIARKRAERDRPAGA